MSSWSEQERLHGGGDEWEKVQRWDAFGVWHSWWGWGGHFKQRETGAKGVLLVLTEEQESDTMLLYSGKSVVQ